MIQLQPIYRVGSGNDQYFIALSNGGFNNGPSEVFISSNREFRWRPWISIKDTGVDTCHGGNRPMALTTQDGKLLLTVLDKCGGGAMEGYDSVLELQSDGKREMVKCYNYDNWGQFEQEEEEGGWSWYARGTTQFDRLEEAPLSECKPNVKIIYQ
ncbi:hypothetical protein FACS1894176_06530 [Bacteroidia bacterium]|nr:hypothetical protein FACS1894176_06530 [Bacteroidia bacterium]